jgi:hypothetical protein
VSTLQLRIPKYSVKATLAALAALTVVSVVLEIIMTTVPQSPTARIQQFLAINHGNPIVYTTHWYQHWAPIAGRLDAFVATPIAMLAAGCAFGYASRRLKGTFPSILSLSVVLGTLLSVGIIILNLGLVALINDVSGSSFVLDPSIWTAGVLLQALVQVVVSAVAFVIGAALCGRGKYGQPVAQ